MKSLSKHSPHLAFLCSNNDVTKNVENDEFKNVYLHQTEINKFKRNKGTYLKSYTSTFTFIEILY